MDTGGFGDLIFSDSGKHFYFYICRIPKWQGYGTTLSVQQNVNMDSCTRGNAEKCEFYPFSFC